MKLFDESLEKRILAYSISSKENMNKVFREKLSELFYDPIARVLLVASKSVFKKHSVLLTTEVLEQILAAQNVDEVKANLCRVMFLEVRAMPVVDDGLYSFYLEQLKNYALGRKLYEIINLSASTMGQVENKDMLNDLMNKLSPLQHDVEEIPLIERYAYESAPERKISYLKRKGNPKDNQGLLFGFKDLDNLTNGLYKKEMALFFGRTNSGKSRVLNNVAFNLAKAGHPGILFSLEMYMDQLERIFDCLGGKVPYTKIKKGELNPDEEAKYFDWLDLQTKEKPPLYLIDYSANCTPTFVQNVIRERKRHQKIEWICLDYLTLMNPDEKWKDETGKYGIIARELKQLAKTEDIAIITASQSNRESAKAKKADTTHISFSDQIGHHCDLVVHLKQNPDQEARKALSFRVVKHRDGKNNFEFELFVDWELNYIGNFNIETAKEGTKCLDTTATALNNLVAGQQPQTS